MDFLTAVKTCFRKYFKFSGRARRSEFWYWVLFIFIAGIVLGIMDNVIFGADLAGDDFQPISAIFTLVTFIPGLAVSWRRLHDINRSGWWIGGGYLAIALYTLVILGSALSIGGTADAGGLELAPLLIAVLSIIFGLGIVIWAIAVLVFFCTDTKAGMNRYGEDPKYDRSVSVFD